MRAEQDPYDSVAYPGLSYPDTHPGRLAAMAILHGLTPAPAGHCRVLEVGCNEGANLISMAYAIPGSEFIGFDLARLPIERGQGQIAELGLTNVRLFVADLLELGPELGQFDYIIAHGVYAWVPEAVSDGLLALCGRMLRPHGIAFVSYNALPGGHMRTMVREMMLFGAEGIEDPQQKVNEAVGFLEFVSAARPEGDAYRLMIEEQLKKITSLGPHVTFHDEMTDAYHPSLFTDFVERAGRHGLQYLSEATLPPPTDPFYRADVRAALGKAVGADVVKQEQMLDFLRARMYRETLLCGTGHSVRRDFGAEQFRRLMLASQVISTPGEGPGATVFTLPGGIRMESNHPGAVALLLALEAAWPRALSLEELEPPLAEAGFVLDGQGTTLLLRLVVAKMIELQTWCAPVAPEVSIRPQASRRSRQEARSGPVITTLLHTRYGLDDEAARGLLQLLDGTRDREGLLEALRGEYPAATQEELAGAVEKYLRAFQRAGLLEG